MITSRRWQSTVAVGFALAATLSLGAAAWQASIGTQDIRVIDGDTLEVDGEVVRVSNLDAPELGGRAGCETEARLAIEARDALAGQVLAEGVTVTLRRDTERPTDRYGRTLAIVLADGRDVADRMIEAGVARPWRGRSSEWCASL